MRRPCQIWSRLLRMPSSKVLISAEDVRAGVQFFELGIYRFIWIVFIVCNVSSSNDNVLWFCTLEHGHLGDG